MIYFDYCANYPAKKEVLDKLSNAEIKYFGNYNSSYKLGQITKDFVNKTSENILKILGFSSDFEVIYTSSATESNNLAIKGIAYSYSGFGKKILVTELEHSSINGTLGYLKDCGFTIELIKTMNDGSIDLVDLENKLDDSVILVCAIFVEGETGYIHDIKHISSIVKKYKNAKLLVDATQGIGKINYDFNCADLITFTPHKFGGIIGSGVLIKRKNIVLTPLINGGESNTVYRSGSVPVGIIASINKAIELAYKNIDNNFKYVFSIHEYLLNSLKTLNGITINSFSNPYIVNISIKGIPAFKVVEYLSNKEIYVSQKSACSIKNTPSKIIMAIYKDRKRAMTSFRISLCELTTKEEIDILVNALKELVK